MANNPIEKHNQWRHLPLIVLLTLVASVYMLTYSARIESTDTLFMFDAVSSAVQFGDFRLDLAHGERRFWDYEAPLPEIPLLPVDAEPLQILLATPLYWLATQTPYIGQVHAVWLFNVLVTTACVGVFYAYALLLGYRVRVAFAGAALYGLATIALPYSKTFFQEPLTALSLLTAALFLERWRQARYRAWGALLAGTLAFVLGMFVRRNALIAVPALLLVVLPFVDALFRRRWVMRVFWGGLALFLLLAYVVTLPQSGQELDTIYRHGFGFQTLDWETLKLQAAINQAIQGYWFSAGGSIWGSSPILLLALGGMSILSAQRHMRYVLVALGVFFSYSLVYAFYANYQWFGGLSWPPRFLVPTVPFLMLTTLPFLQALEQVRARAWRWTMWGSVMLLALYSLWIQFNAVSYAWERYAALLPAESEGYIEWRGGLIQPQYFRWVLLPQLWGREPFDFAWVRTGTWSYPLVFGGLIVVALVCLWALPRVAHIRRVVWALPLAWTVAVVWGLVTMRADNAYLAFSEGLAQAQAQMQAQVRADDALVIARRGHERFFLNYGENIPARMITLPDHPGEQPSPEQPPEIRSPHPTDLLERPSAQLLDFLATQHERLWLLADNSPFLAWSVRPVEQYLSRYYFPLTAQDFTGADGLPVRLLSYYVGAHAAPYALMGAAEASSVRFEGDIALAGYTLPQGNRLHAGDVLPISLYWLAEAQIPADFAVSLHLVGSAGVVASAQDSMPANGFSAPSTWRPYAPVWDNRAIALPPDLPPGEYALWLGIYRLDASGQPLLVPVVQGERAEGGTLAILETSLTVLPPASED